MASKASNKADRIFVQNGRRLYRRTFSATEPRIGFVILVFLTLLFAWIAWRGARPDPNLFALETVLSQSGGAVAPGAAPVGRGPVPANLAIANWSESEISQFGYDDLYVKINGREGYYKAFGFERLYFLSLVSEADPQSAVDIELYDLGTAANAVGAYSGERSPDATPEVGTSGLSHIDRNALYMTRGRYYLRAIGSAESAEILAQLQRIKERFESDLEGEPLPWGHALLVGKLGMDPGSVSFTPENAFSFGFASNVYSVTLDDDAELFVTPGGDSNAATELAAKYLDGFRQYGEDEGNFVKDRYMGTYATARAAGAWVVGIRHATDPAGAKKRVDDLAAAVRDVPLPAVAPSRQAQGEKEEYEADGY